MPQPKLTAEQKIAIYEKNLHDDFKYFLRAVWKHMNLPEPSRVQYDIADFLQHGPPRMIVEGFRGLAKTWITSAFCLWRLYIDPKNQITLSSASEGLSLDTLFMIREWVELMPFLRKMVPQLHQRDAARKFDIGDAPPGDRTASVRAVGITGALPGGRATLIVVDDAETPENSMTRDQRLKQHTRVEGFEHLLYPAGRICVLGTPQNEETLYDYMVKELSYVRRTWPIAYPDPDMYVPDLSPMLQKDLDEGKAQPGDPIWPERFDREYIVEKRSRAKTTFLMQYMLVGNLSELNRYPLQLADLIVYPVHRDMAPANIAWGKSDHNGSTIIEDISPVGLGDDAFFAPIYVEGTRRSYHGCKAFIDPAGRGEDEMAWAIIGQLHGYLFLKHVGAVKGGATVENMDAIVKSLRQHNCTELGIETNFGGDMLIQLIKPVIQRFALQAGEDDAYPNGWNCCMACGPNGNEGIHSAGQKEVRIIDTLEPVCNQHRLVVDPQVAADQELWYQFTRLTRDRGSLEHDDRVDALAGCVSLFAQLLDQDAKTQENVQKERDSEQRLREYYGQPEVSSIYRHSLN